MSLTLVEAAKLHSGDVVRSAVIELFARNSDVMRILPFRDIPGNAFKYNLEGALPGIGFRGVNESYTPSTGVLNPQVEPLVIAGGELDVDRFITETMGADQRAVQEAMKIKALARKWDKTFIKGDTETTPKEFDGLQRRLTGDQLISAGSTSGGDALSLAKLDELIDAVDNPQYLIMSKAVRRLLSAAARLSTVGGYITYEQDAFGRKQTMYGDLPILLADKDNNNTDILGYNEAGAGGGNSVCTSIYCISTDEDKVQGLQNGTMDVTVFPELEEKPASRTRVEWYTGVAVFHPKGAARLYGIKSSAVTV